MLKTLSPWQAALMTAGGQILANNRPGASPGQALGAGISSFAPTLISAQGAQDRQKYLETLQKYKQQKFESEQAAAQQAAQRDAAYRQAIDSGAAFEGMTDEQRAKIAPLIAVGDYGGVRDVLQAYAKREPKSPSAFEAFLSGDPRAAQWKRMGAARTSTTVNMPDQIQFGKIEPGYMMVQENGGYMMKPVPGSPASLEVEDRVRAEQEGVEQRQQKSDIVTEDIDRALTKVRESPNTTTGAFGSVLSQVPGTEAHDVSKLIDTIKANSAFDALQAMRDASKTGGALGAVSERELQLLQSTVGNLEQSQSQEQFERNLMRVRDVYEDIVHGPGDHQLKDQSDNDSRRNELRQKYNLQ